MSQHIQKEIVSWLGVFLGTFIMSAGFVYFINPYNIIPGGVYGCSIVLHNLFPTIQVGWFGYMFDIPLLILATLLLGARLGAKTVGASLITPLIMNGLSSLSYPTKEALQNLDPSQLLGGALDFSNELILAVLAGSVMIGVGCGIVVRSGATTGGTDIVAMIMQKYTHLRFSTGILLVDGAVVLFGLVVIGFIMGGPVSLSIYSLVSIYLSSRMVAWTLNGSKDDKIVFIISDQPLDSLRTYILEDLERTATRIKTSGLYTGEEKQMLFFVASYKEVQALKSKIKEADPRAFVIVTDAYDTYGEGWKQLPNADEVQPE